MIFVVTKENFATIQQSTKPVVLDAYATWCGPCQQMKPIFKQLAEELGDTYLFAELNVDEAMDVAVKLSISRVPTFVFIKDNQIRGSEVGFMNKEDLKERILELLG